MTDFKAIRTKLGFTQKELGELLGIDPTQISKAENGHDVPAMYEYALKGLQAEAAPDEQTGPVVDVEAYENKIKELEAQIEADKIDASNRIAALETTNRELQKNTVTPATTEQPKKRRGLGRPKGAKIHGME